MAGGQYSATTIMLPFQVITLSPSEVMKQKRDIILGYYHDCKEQLRALAVLHDYKTMHSEQLIQHAGPIITKYQEYRQWLDNYTLSLLTSEQELKDECDLNALESTLGSAE